MEGASQARKKESLHVLVPESLLGRGLGRGLLGTQKGNPAQITGKT